MSVPLTLVPTPQLYAAAWSLHELVGRGRVCRAADVDFHDRLGQLLADAWKGKVGDALDVGLEVMLANPSTIMTDSLLEEALTKMGAVFGGEFAGEVTDGVADLLGEAFGAASP